jgi:diguanylate cyclase (GGDEF)-like protein
MKVLVADDDPVHRHVLEVILTRWGYEVVLTTDGTSACRVLEEDDPPKLAVLDWMMPGLDGPQVCRRVRQRPGGKYVYLILLTARSHKDDLLQGLEAGADDYLIKPFDPAELKARLQTGRRILDLQDELLAAREAMRDLATRDALTGVWNHAAIQDALRRELIRAAREGRPLGVILADLDHFKRVNDTFGHLAGDAVLREAARRMTTAVRPYDLVGRYGGEEFLLVLPGCDQAKARKFAERIRTRLAAEPVTHQGHLIPITVSMGVTVYDQPDPAEPTALLHAADVALYRAKHSGRNRAEVSPFPPPAGAGG